MASVQQIRDRLLQVIDKDGTVLNSTIALEIVTMLENISVTKDELEETRLGKYVNLVRKAAKDPSLQKRAKRLIKTWQQMITNTIQQPVKKDVHTPVSKGSIKNKNIKNAPTINTTVSVNGDRKKPCVKRKLETSSPDNHKTKRKMESSTFGNSCKITKLSDANPSAFTCMTNGLKVKFTTLPAATSSLKDSSVANESKKKVKKELQDNISPELLPANRTTTGTSNTDNFLVQKKRSSKSDLNVRDTQYSTPRKKSDFSHQTLEPRVTSSDQSCISVQNKHYATTLSTTQSNIPANSQWGDYILHSSPLSDKFSEKSGIDGCRTNDGTWYSWADSITIRRIKSIDLNNPETKDPNVLNIFPYCELD